MSVDTSLKGWLEELRHSGETLEPFLASLDGSIATYTGQHYQKGKGKKAHDNYCLEWFSLMRSQHLMGDPQYRWSSPTPSALAPALTMAMNQLSRRLQLSTVNEQLLTNFGFKWCVACVTNEPIPGSVNARESKRWPSVSSIPLKRYRFDAAADKPESRRWKANLVIASRKQIRALAEDPDSGWSRDALDKLEKQNVRKFYPKDQQKTPDRDEFAYWNIWCMDEDHADSPGRKKGYNGSWYTVVDMQDEKIGWVRKPMPAFVPPWGPFTEGGDYLVPDSSIPMGTLTAAAGQGDFVNRTRNAMLRAIENYKRILVAKDPKLAKLIRDGQDDYVYHADIEDLVKGFFSGEIGGATDQHFIADQVGKTSLDTVLGVNDLMRGRVDPSHKATQDALASQASGARMSGTGSKFAKVVHGYSYTMGYMIDIDDEVEVELGDEARGMFVDPKTGEEITTLRGGHHEDQDAEEFFRLGLELRVGSMERSLEMDNQLQSMAIDQHVQQTVALGPMSSLFIDHAAIGEFKSELFGMPILKRVVNVEAMRAIGLAMLQGGMQQGQQGGAPSAQGQKPQATYVGNPQKSAGSSALKLAGTLGGKAGSTPSADGGASKARAAGGLTAKTKASSSGYR